MADQLPVVQQQLRLAASGTASALTVAFTSDIKDKTSADGGSRMLRVGIAATYATAVNSASNVSAVIQTSPDAGTHKTTVKTLSTPVAGAAATPTVAYFDISREIAGGGSSLQGPINDVYITVTNNDASNPVDFAVFTQKLQ